MPYRKKLIEVSLPLEAINKEAAREKSIRHGHPSTLHLWWARRPLAACRAVLFASLVDDPSEYMPDEESARLERERLFRLIEELVKWENSNNEEVLDKARLEIARSVARTLNVDPPIGREAVREFLAAKAPPVLDPFAGGGSIPLEAQRLGLRAYASDLNPVAVLINKALIEIPPKFANMPPVHPPTPGPSPMQGEGSAPRLEIPEGLRRKMVEIARQFRKEPTPSEAILWQALRGKQLDGVKFRRQQPIGPFVVDFFAPALRLVVEVDGLIHAFQQEADRARQEILESLGLVVLRLDADEVESHLGQSLDKIRAVINERRAPPSPRVGEGGRGVEGVQMSLFQKEWKGTQGLAEDVRYYGQWMRDEAFRRIGHLYPPVTVTAEMLAERPDLKEQGLKPGDQLTVIAWLWARTVKCPNPACGARMPLVRSFALSTKKGKAAWVEPVIEGNRVRFTIRQGSGTPPEGTVNRNGARCICCGTPVPLDHVRAEGKAGRMSAQMMAIVAEGKNGRVYLPPASSHEKVAASAQPAWKPETNLPEKALGFRVQLYGMEKHADLFTPRQLTALTTFSDLVGEARQKVLEDASRLAGGPGVRAFPEAYADAVATYLGMAVSRQSNRMSTICFWDTAGENVQQVFARQALPMTWDFAEANPFSNSSGSFHNGFDYICTNLERLTSDVPQGNVSQNDASKSLPAVVNPVVSTDPPYYDNIGYADLSDYFYTWLRVALNMIIPNIFDTVLVPKAAELIATPYRFDGDKKKAEEFFETGLRHVFQLFHQKANNMYPVTIFYA